MKIINFILLLLLVFLNFNCCTYQTNHQIYYKDKKSLVQHLENSTVVILRKYTDDQSYKTSCAGVWVSNDRILTARHCAEVEIEDKNSLLSPMNDLTKLPGVIMAYKTHDQIDNTFKLGKSNKPHFALVIAYDPQSDLALLETIDHPDHENIIISSEEIFDGEDVNIVGHTNGMEYTYFPGVVASAQRMMSPFGIEWKLIQVAAPLFGGNSGGGIFDSDGKLIGITSFIRTNVPNMGFAVHNQVILQFLKQENII